MVMEKSEILGLPLLLEHDSIRHITSQKVFLLEVGAEELQMLPNAAHMKNSANTKLTFAAQSHGFLILDGSGFVVTQGQAKCYPLNLNFFIKLLAFSDEAQGIVAQVEPSAMAVAIALETIDMLRDQRHAEDWFVSILYQQQTKFTALFSLLRRTEHYSLIRFLLSQTVDGENLHVLGERYGVSYSHFRRLCQRALGGATKTELRAWRLARALLDPAAGNSFTDVALKYGYASSSHFSNEVKEVLGVSPRHLSNITNMVSK